MDNEDFITKFLAKIHIVEYDEDDVNEGPIHPSYNWTKRQHDEAICGHKLYHTVKSIFADPNINIDHGDTFHDDNYVYLAHSFDDILIVDRIPHNTIIHNRFYANLIEDKGRRVSNRFVEMYNIRISTPGENDYLTKYGKYVG